MTLDHEHPPSPDDLIRYGEDSIVTRLREAAIQESALGDGRALRTLHRLLEVCGYSRRRGGDDDGN